jgi:transposase
MSGRISKIGDAGVRAVLYEAAKVILSRPVKGGVLKSWAMRIAGPIAQASGCSEHRD